MDEEDRFEIARHYVAAHTTIPVDAYTETFETLLNRVRKLAPLPAGSRVCEVGVGDGSFLIHAARAGLACDGLELIPSFAKLAERRAAEVGVRVRIRVGDVQDPHALERGVYDLVVASSVLEHVPDARGAVQHMCDALRPGGVFYMNSTNKFALRSGEYPRLRFYGWLPYKVRRRIRVADYGPGIVASGGMDFHQFTPYGLRRALRRAGFSRVLDIYQLLDPQDLNRRTMTRVMALWACKHLPGARAVVSAFGDGTHFFCVK